MCTPRTRLPRRSVSSESASSKSRADSGSQVKMNFFRRSSRPFAGIAPRAIRRASSSAAGGNALGSR